MRNLRIKSVMRFDEIQGHFRLFRIMWEVGTPGDGKGYSNKLAVGLMPKVFNWEDGRLTILGLRVHLARSMGGIWA